MQEENGGEEGEEGPPGTRGRPGLLLEEKPLPALLVSVAVAALLGAVAFLAGESTGANLDQAERQGRAAGTSKGAERGGARGYLAGFSKARKRAYEKAYGTSYRRSYANAYGEAGLDEPDLTSIEVSR